MRPTRRWTRVLFPLVLLCLTSASYCDDQRGSGCSSDPLGPGCSSAVLEGQAQLAIAPSIQQTEVWCWAATAEMVFQYYGLPNINPYGNYQCGIVAAWFGTQGFPQCLENCGLCPYPVGAMSNELRVITDYGPFVRTLGIPSRALSANLIFRSLSAQEIKLEIDAGRPIVLGIAPGGGFALPNASAHIAIMVGYDFSRGSQRVIVNDPFPFEFAPYNQYPHPYLSVGGIRLQPGQFSVPLSALYGRLGWANTIYRIG